MNIIRNLAKVGLLTAFVASVSFASSAEDKWQGIASFDVANINVKGNTPSFSIGLGAYQKVHPNVMAGFGAQITESWKFKGNPSFPIFVGLHAEKFEEKMSPVLDFTTGICLNTSEIDYSSYYMNPMVGVRFGRYGIGVGYLGSIAMAEGAQWESYINIRLAYYFGYHKTKMSESIKNNTNFGMELSADIPLNSGESIRGTFGEGINFYLLYSVNDNFELGPMVGAHYLTTELKDYWSDYEWEGDHGSLWAPVALRGKYNFLQIAIGGKFYPWARLDIGGSISIGDELKSGFYYSPAVGLSLDVRGGKSSIDLGLSYTGLSTGLEDDWTSQKTSRFTTHMLSIALGYTF
ncbi:MAG: hypothetical protein K2M68_04140 [Muribaculaceae bacterium]|nr:hypothetical protein [Muribaculaceae bacterium]